MYLLSSALLATLVLACSILLPGTEADSTLTEIFTRQSHIVQKRGTPKHRGSGRREIVSLTEIWVS